MTSALDEQREYLSTLAAACSARPDVHAHQLAALEVERDLCARAATIAGYLAASDDTFELARAAQLDRLANELCVAVELDDRWGARAALIAYGHTLEATGHDDWVACLWRASEAARDANRRSVESGTCLTRMLGTLVRWRAAEMGGGDCARYARDALAALVEADPAFDLRALGRRPYLRLRIPWDDSALGHLAGWLDELAPELAAVDDPAPAEFARMEFDRLQAAWRTSLADRARGARAQRVVQPGPEPEAGNDDFLAGYRALADSTTPRLRHAARNLIAAAHGAASSKKALTIVIRDGHLAAVAAAAACDRAENALGRQSFWPDPLVAHHWQGLLNSLQDARTTTEVDLLLRHAGACFAIEADWQVLWMISVLAPLQSALMHGMLGACAAGPVGESVSVSAQLLGRGPRAMLASAQIEAFCRRNLAMNAAEEDTPRGAALGEAGSSLITPLRAWLAMGAAGGDTTGPTSPDIASQLRTLLDSAGAAEPWSEPGRWIQLWQRQVAPERCAELLAAPRRPPVPGWP